jgi:phosphoglycolate phosphatase-like HAD superfamily hydrolase
MQGIQVVIFDCDGVMFDTSQANTQYYNHILDHFGKPGMTSAQFNYVHMHTVDQALAFLFDDSDELAAARAYRRNMSYLPFLKYMQIEPDLKAVLQRLRPRYKTAVATNRTDTMNRVLETHGLHEQFDLVVTALDVRNPKPEPDQLVKILEYFRCRSREAVYIGDSPLDARAATSAGVPFVAFANRSLSADYHINRLGEIEGLLGNTTGPPAG